MVDKTRGESCGSNMAALCEKGILQDQENILGAVRYCKGSIMIWSCFAALGLNRLPSSKGK